MTSANRVAVVTLAVPNARSNTVRRFAASAPVPLHRRIADAIRAFAERRGIAPSAVDYSVSWQGA